MSNEIRLLSMAFRTDAHYNLILAKAAREHQLYARESMRAKTLVLVHMSIECSLKCIVVVERPTKDLGYIYKIIKKCGHKLSDLVDLISMHVLDHELRAHLKQFNPPGVGLRYGFEVMILNADKLFQSDRSPHFQESQLDEAFKLAEFVSELATGLHKTTYPENFKWENGDSRQRVIDRIKQAGRNR